MAKPKHKLKTAMLVLRIHPSVKAAAIAEAGRLDRSVSNYVERLIIKDTEEAKS